MTDSHTLDWPVGLLLQAVVNNKETIRPPLQVSENRFADINTAQLSCSSSVDGECLSHAVSGKEN